MKKIYLVLFALTACRHSEAPSHTQGQIGNDDPPDCRPAKYDQNCPSGNYTEGLYPWNDAFLEGRGLERLHFNGPFTPSNLPVQFDSTSACGSNDAVSVTVTKCDPSPSYTKDGVATCILDVAKGHGICNDKNGNPHVKDVPVLIVAGYWDNKGAWSQGTNNEITIACHDPNPPTSNSWWMASAISACFNNKYYPQTPPNQKFLACIRATRADYCGDGFPHTLSGTDLVLRDKDNAPDGYCGFYHYEGSWSPDGVVCLDHDRWTGKGMSSGACAFPYTNAQNLKCRLQDESSAVLFSRSECNQCPRTDAGAPSCPNGETDPYCQHKPKRKAR
jgi:hypothetical protein